MDKNEYARRLRKMIETKKTPYTWCPTNLSRMGMAHVGDICNDLCRDFVKLKPRPEEGPRRIMMEYAKNGAEVYLYRCPCLCLGKKRAITRAMEYLDQYDEGTHHWQKEE